MNGAKHRIIPIFMPEMACPYRCVYCNQRVITGQYKSLSENEIKDRIDSYLPTFPDDAIVELAFYGGTFTGLPAEEQERMLNIVYPYVKSGKIHNVRLSTRPDYIKGDNVEKLKSYSVTDIELGVQSMDDDVLRKVGRGYTSADVELAVKTIQRHGIDVGMQMMIGLPGDSREKALYTAHRIVVLGASNTRIYPTLVIENTALEVMYRNGAYKPLSIEDAVEWCSEIVPVFEEGNVTIMRIGLHPTESFLNGSGYLAGPFHVSFRELVESAMWRKALEGLVSEGDKGKVLELRVPERSINYVSGYRSENRHVLEEHFKSVRIVGDSQLSHREFKYAIL